MMTELGYPLPRTVSEEAIRQLELSKSYPRVPWPAENDPASWEPLLQAMTPTDPVGLRAVALAVSGVTDTGADVDVERVPIGDVDCYIGTPSDAAPGDDRVVLDLHGGAWTVGGGEVCRYSAELVAGALGVRIWAVDYRMPPRYPFPAALDDALEVYRNLLERHPSNRIIVKGMSAGANIAAALLLRIRDEDLPFPAGVILNSPPTDLTESSDTWQTNRPIDSAATEPLTPQIRVYSAGHPLEDPLLSPAFGAFDRTFPPIVLISGTRDVLLSDTVRLHRALRRAGVEASLHVFEAAPHGLFGGRAPEDAEQVEELRRFIAATAPLDPRS